MIDQANKLRELIHVKQPPKEKVPTDARIIAVSSGKGGVGKTNFTVNTAIALSKMNKRVTVIDADLGLANIDILLGLVPKYTLTHVLRNEKVIEDIILKGPNDIKIISGGSGVMDLVNLSSNELDALIKTFEYLNDDSDFILIDTGAGLNQSVLSFIQAAQELIVVVTSDPTSITDAYALIKNIKHLNIPIKIVVNRVESNKEGHEVFHKLNSATTKFLNFEMDNLGFVYEDPCVKKSVRNQIPFIVGFPNALATKGIELIANTLLHNSDFTQPEGGFKSFIKKIFKNKG